MAIETDSAKITDLEAALAKIETLQATLANVEKLVSQTIITDDLAASNATITNLDATLANIGTAIIEIAKVEDLQAANAQIENLNAQYINAVQANVETLNAKSATIEQLNAYTLKSEFGEFQNLTTENLKAANADIGTLNANVANVINVLAGAVGTGLLQAIHLTADNVVIDDAVIKSAMIDNIDTDIVRIGNDNIIISGSTQQFKDDNGVVRIQIGKDAQGNFNFTVFGEDGTTRIYSHEGITDKAVPDGLIVDKMVSAEAGIQASKIKYVTKDGDTTLQTVIEIEQGRIDTLIKETRIENVDGTTTSIKDVYVDMKETVNGYNTTIANVRTDINTLTGEVEDMSSSIAEIKQTSQEVSTMISSMDMTNRNYIRNSKTMIFETYGFINDPQEDFVADELNYLTDEDGNMYVY